MAEIMKRIAELRVMRWRVATGKFDPEVQPAALDWIDMTIAEHERDIEVMVRGGVQIGSAS